MFAPSRKLSRYGDYGYSITPRRGRLGQVDWFYGIQKEPMKFDQCPPGWTKEETGAGFRCIEPIPVAPAPIPSQPLPPGAIPVEGQPPPGAIPAAPAGVYIEEDDEYDLEDYLPIALGGAAIIGILLVLVMLKRR